MLQTTPTRYPPYRAIQKDPGLDENNLGFPSFSGTLFCFYFLAYILFRFNQDSEFLVLQLGCDSKHIIGRPCFSFSYPVLLVLTPPCVKIQIFFCWIKHGPHSVLN